MLHVLAAELGACALEVRREDAASLDYSALARELGATLSVAGNLPYAITGAILRNLGAHRAALARVVVMVQREVRDRLEAAPGTADYGALTVFTSAAFEIETLLRLPPGAFHPPPKVHSAVVHAGAARDVAGGRDAGVSARGALGVPEPAQDAAQRAGHRLWRQPLPNVRWHARTSTRCGAARR